MVVERGCLFGGIIGVGRFGGFFFGLVFIFFSGGRGGVFVGVGLEMFYVIFMG